MKRLMILTIVGGFLGGGSPAAASGADAPRAPTNQWALVEDATDGGTSAGIAYVPKAKGMFLWGIRARKDWRGRELSRRYWAELFEPASGEWSELVPNAGRVEVFQGRGTWVGKWVKHESGYEMPALPGCNRAYWHANQFCYVPDLKKVFYYQGGMTFTYDPVPREFANLEIPFEQSPPDVMLGSMAWDPVNRQVILFGGGYVHQADWHTWDKRGTWAYNPADNSWRKLTTGSHEMFAAFDRLDKMIKGPMRDLWGGCRAVAFEYADRTGGTKAAGLSADAATLSQQLRATADNLAGQGADDYEKSRFGGAADILRERVCPKLVEAADALKTDDGWKAFHALQSTYNCLIDAREAVAVAPRPRHYARLVTDPVNKVIVLWGGDGEDRFFADTWLFDLVTGRWERCRPDVHPANVGSAMVGMDYDSKNKVVVLVRQDGEVWTFDAKDRQWHKLAVAGFQGGATFMGMEYDPASDLHVLVAMKGQERKTQTLRLDVVSAEVADAESSPGTEEVWRPGYGAGSGHPGDKVGRTWQLLPKTQSEFRERVADTKKFLDSVPVNEWTCVPNPYGGFGRAYGSFCYDWDRDEIVLWGGGHSAYMGNEWSQYHLESNLWMESWNPEFPVHPYGSPDGPGWHPSFYHQQGTHHGYHHYVYNGQSKMIAYRGGVRFYDPDRMRYSDRHLTSVGAGSTGLMVAMNGDSRLLTVPAHYYRGGPFRVRQANFEEMTLEPIEDSNVPFASNDRAKVVFDTKRQRILYYGARSGENRVCNELWAFPLGTGKWERIEIEMTGGGTPPQISNWDYGYSAKHDCLMVGSNGTWILDLKTRTMKQVCEKASGPGIVYSPHQDLFCTLHGGGYKMQEVWVFRYKPER